MLISYTVFPWDLFIIIDAEKIFVNEIRWLVENSYSWYVPEISRKSLIVTAEKTKLNI